MPSASVDAGTRHCRASGQAGTLPTSSASPVRRNGGTCARATPSEASVAHSAIAPSAEQRRAHRRAPRRSAPEAPHAARVPRRTRARARTEVRIAFAPSRDDRARIGFADAAAALRVGLGLHAGGPLAPARQIGVERVETALDDLRRRLRQRAPAAPARASRPRRRRSRRLGIASVAPHCGAAHRLARRQRGAAGGALHRLLARLGRGTPSAADQRLADRARAPAGRRRAGSAPSVQYGQRSSSLPIAAPQLTQSIRPRSRSSLARSSRDIGRSSPFS